MNIIHTAIAAHQIKQYQDEIKQILRWPAGPRRDHHLAIREQLIEEMEQVIEMGAEMASAIEDAAAEVIEIATPSQQLEEIAAELSATQPALRWRVDGLMLIGNSLGAWSVLVWRVGRGWSGKVVGYWWDDADGEHHGDMTAAAGSAATTAMLLITSMAAREQVAA